MPSLLRTLPEQFNRHVSHGAWPAHCDGDPVFDDPRLAGVCAAWSAARGAAAMPWRGDVCPRRFGDLMHDVAIVDYVEPPFGLRRYRFAMAGSALAAQIGEVAGRYLDEMVPEPMVGIWLLALDMALRAGKPLRFTGRLPLPAMAMPRAEVLLAPLSDLDGEAQSVLGAISFLPEDK
ncbi:MAG: PAS domain-containing protein [Proteobacteria bacterium]|nr:PAS domain-containing protein [Pseudomonadota bacterium]